MLPPDSNDILDKLRHAVAVSGSGLPIHKGDEKPEPEPPPPPPMPYDDDGVFDMDALQSNLNGAIRQQEMDAEAKEAEERAAAEEVIARAVAAKQAKSPASDILHHPVLNPVLPRDLSEYRHFDMEEDNRPALSSKLLVAGLVGLTLLIAGGAMIADKKGWMNIRAVHIKSGQGQSANAQAGAGRGMIKVMTPPPPGGPTQDDIESAADQAITTHYASLGIGSEMRASLNSLRIIARQPTESAATWQVLMTMTVHTLPEGAPHYAAEIKQGYPEKGVSTVLDLPKNAGSAGAPPSVPFISAPLPAQQPDNGTVVNAPPRKDKTTPPALEPQPRWVDVNWSGERWFIGDYEFD